MVHRIWKLEATDGLKLSVLKVYSIWLSSLAMVFNLRFQVKLCDFKKMCRLLQALAWHASNSPHPSYRPQKSRKQACAGNKKSTLIYSCVGWHRPLKILSSSSRIYFNWYNRIDFKLIILSLPFKSYFLR